MHYCGGGYPAVLAGRRLPVAGLRVGLRVRGGGGSGSVGCRDRGFGSGDGGLRYSSGAAISKGRTLFSFPGSRSESTMTKLKREPLSRETRASRRGSGGMPTTICSLGAAGRDGDVGTGQRVDLVENLGLG
jgi:hypothetical protein